MSVGKKILWGGLGWVLGGPIGAIIGYSLAGFTGQPSNANYQYTSYPQTQPGDFIVSLLVLFGAVMKADHELKKSELEFIKNFNNNQFSKLSLAFISKDEVIIKISKSKRYKKNL